jgi:Protein of unknown function (DUF3592)
MGSWSIQYYRPPRNLLVIIVPFTIVGAAFCVFALYTGWSRYLLLRDGITVPGTVVELRGSNSSSLSPIVRYRDHDGHERTLYSASAAYPPAFFVGESVQIIYRPLDPNFPLSARINTRWELWGLVTLLSLLGTAFLFFAGLMILMKKRDAPGVGS